MPEYPPVDQAEIPVRQEQEVVAHAVDMGRDLPDGSGGQRRSSSVIIWDFTSG